MQSGAWGVVHEVMHRAVRVDCVMLNFKVGSPEVPRGWCVRCIVTKVSVDHMMLKGRVGTRQAKAPPGGWCTRRRHRGVSMDPMMYCAFAHLASTKGTFRPLHSQTGLKLLVQDMINESLVQSLIRDTKFLQHVCQAKKCGPPPEASP